MRRRRPNDSGMVSVYFIMITAAFVLFAGVLIDYSRIAVFRAQAELTVKASARSVLSSYDPSLYGMYGLFIRGGDPAVETSKLVTQGDNEQSSSMTFSYAKPEWKEAEAMESRPLADYAIFRRQVMEEMKYKAPINLTLEWLSRFRELSGPLHDASRTANSLERMTQAYDAREAALDRVLQYQVDTGAAMVEAYGSVMKAESESSGADGAPTELPVAAYNRGKQLVAEARRQLQTARTLDESIVRLTQEAKAASPANTSSAASLDDVRNSMVGMELGNGYFEAYQTELDRQEAWASNWHDRVVRWHTMAVAEWQKSESAPKDSPPKDSSDTKEGDVASALRQAAWNEASQAYTAYELAYGASPEGAVLAARRKQLIRQRSPAKDRKLQEQKAAAAQKGAVDWLRRVSTLQSTQQARQAFSNMLKLAQENRAWNNKQSEAGLGEPPLAQSSSVVNRPGSQGESALHHSDGWLNALTSAAEQLRGTLYMAEYVYERYSRFEPSYLRETMEVAGTDLTLERMETEMILYGFADPSALIAAAYGEIFAFRLAVRTMEGLIESRSYGHPLVIWAASLAYGFAHALTDMQKLVQTGKIELTRYAKIDTLYGDYIRLFLYAHGNHPGTASRSIALIEHKLGLSLQKAYTYVRVERRAALRLWFYPAALNVLERAGILGGAVGGGWYEASFAADSAYL